MSAKFDFLTSPRFWQLFLAGVAAGLNDYQAHNNWMSAVSIAIGVWLGGSVVVGTVDRTVNKLSNKTEAH